MADEFRCKVERERLSSGREGQLLVQATRNGYQWSTLTLDDDRQLEILHETIGLYLRGDT